MELKDYMMLYGVTLGKRRTKKQRYLFAQSVKEQVQLNNAAFSVQSHNTKRYNIENIVVGNPDTAEYIIACGYDTPIKNIIKCNYYPFHKEKTLQQQKNDLAVNLIISILLFVSAFVLIIQRGMVVINIILSSILVFAGIYNLFSKTNEVNFNRYSASVAAAMKMSEENKKLCIVFCDKICQGYDGYRLLAENVKSNQQVIILDSIAYGEKLVIAHSDKTNVNTNQLAKQLDALDKTYKEDKISRNVLSILPKAVFLTSGVISDGELIVENTGSKNDFKLDMNRLEKITDVIIKYTRNK